MLDVYWFVHAGGFALAIEPLARRLRHEGLRTAVVEYPGHGTRLDEPLAGSIEDLAARLECDLFGRPTEDAASVALLGHSLGAMVAFELAWRLEARGRMPVHVVLCGAPCPGAAEIVALADLPDEALIDFLEAAGASFGPLRAEPELRALFIPILRADLRLAKDWRLPPGRRLKAPITAIAAHNDPIAPPRSMAGWRQRTDGRYEEILLSGNHFFIEPHLPAVVAALRFGATVHRDRSGST